MSGSTFGTLFRITTWGESHGAGIGVVIDGCPAGLPLSEADIQAFLDRRKPGQSKYTTKRQEGDQVEICPASLRGRRPAHRFLFLYGIRISAPAITATLPQPIVRDMPTIHLTPNTASAITAAAVVLPAEKRSAGSPAVLLPLFCCVSSAYNF